MAHTAPLTSSLTRPVAEGVVPFAANYYSTLFDGSNDYMVCGNSATLNPADITISAWIKPGGLTNWDYLVTRGTDHYDRAYRFEVGGSNLFCAFGDGAGRNNVSITAAHGMSNGNWYHVAVTFDGSNAALYVDGASIGTASISIVMDTSSQTTYVCFPVASNPHFSGHVDEVAIFSSALTAENIASIYNAGTPTDLMRYSPISWWRMGDGGDVSAQYGVIMDQMDTTRGSELITKGDFELDSGWTKGPGWTISGGTASSDGTQSSNSDLYQDAGLDAYNTPYEVTFTVSDYSAGTVRCVVGGSAVGLYRSANGTYTEKIGVWGGPNFYMQSNSSFVGSIDNVSVRKIGGNPGTIINSPIVGTDIPA